ncbi:MAG TPA: DUF6379 domain-containing protein [Microbacterium sp.]|uniref:C-glycoside deglycosidase beta subunit domain-containing protein n=1 Tax=Microbacterium sp. TaxID=51671 RepID=UPI002CF26542|nr:DUF6379 domain-containing protein [Microbacterium sp.]HWI30744.1 DUF6379 domain-containing protein [Microbacterium sp.]
MTNEGFLVVPDSAAVEGGTLTYRVRLPWYRSLPLSAVEDIAVAVDGADVPADRIRIRVNGGEYKTKDLHERWEDIWFIQDEATIVVPDPGTDAPERSVMTRIALRSPYIMIGPDTPLVTHSTKTHTFHLEGAAQ